MSVCEEVGGELEVAVGEDDFLHNTQARHHSVLDKMTFDSLLAGGPTNCCSHMVVISSNRPGNISNLARSA